MSEQALTPQATDQEVLKAINDAIAANTTQADIRFSRLAMLQPQSPEITQQQPGYKQGMIIDNLTREVLSVEGKAPWLIARGVDPATLPMIHYCLVAFIFKLPSEYIKWIRKEDQVAGNNPWEFKTLDPRDPNVIAGIWPSQGGTFKGKKPPVTINTNYLLTVLDEQLRISNGNFRVGTFSRTSAGCGQSIATLLQSHRMQGITPWAQCYYLSTLRKDKPQSHYVFQVARGPKLLDVAEPFVSEQCLQMAQGLTGSNGELMQTIIINSATLAEDQHTDDAEIEGGASATSDPFADPGTKDF